MKCNELKAYKADVTIPVYGTIADEEVYLKKDVDAAIAELKEFAEDACLERDDNQTAIDELQAENAELKQKLESVQASMYCDVVDANMENRRLKRALWLARAERANNAAMFWSAVWKDEPSGCNEIYDIDFNVLTDKLKRRSFDWIDVFEKVERKCLKKAEQYK